MTQEFILGGYTKRDNEGFHQIFFNPNDGTFSKTTLISKLNNPTFVALNDDKTLLFAIHQDGEKAGLVVFNKIENKQWEQIDQCMATDIPGCHVSWREESQTVYVANYHEGSIDVYAFKDNTLSHIQRVSHSGSSVHPNQTKPHIHYTGMNQDHTLLFACDLGTDIVATYTIGSDGQISLKHEYKLEAGTGPRHLVFHPSYKYMYVIGELANTTTVLSVSESGKLKALQSVANVDTANSPDNTAGAAIRLTSDGKFLYTSTRYNDTISVYGVSEDGSELTPIERVDSVGQVPRDFILDETEQYVLVAHQDSDHITVFSRDAETGRLKYRHNETYAPECVCICPAS